MKFKNVAIYVRVSTDIQVDGYSIDEQLERLEKYCDAHSWKIYNKYVDPGYSGGNIDRPAMLRMIKDAREKKIDVVLVYKLDRLSRSQKDTLYLIEEEFLPLVGLFLGEQMMQVFTGQRSRLAHLFEGARLGEGRGSLTGVHLLFEHPLVLLGQIGDLHRRIEGDLVFVHHLEDGWNQVS